MKNAADKSPTLVKRYDEAETMCSRRKVSGINNE